MRRQQSLRSDWKLIVIFTSHNINYFSIIRADILSIYQPSQKEVDALQKENDQKVIDEFLAKETRKGTM